MATDKAPAIQSPESEKEVSGTPKAETKSYNVLTAFAGDKAYNPGDRVKLDPNKETTKYLLTNKIIK